MNKRTKVLNIIVGVFLVTCLVILVHKDIENNLYAKETEFTDLPMETQNKIKQTQTTITTVQAKALNNSQVVNTDDNEHIITDHKADFEKGKLYQLTFTGDWLTEVKEIK